MNKVLAIINKFISLTWSYLKTMQTKADESNSLVSMSLPIVLFLFFNRLLFNRFCQKLNVLCISISF
jgi:hypothetical protein